MFSFVFFMSSDIFSDIFLQIFYLHSSRQSRIKVSACATACPLILLRFPVKWYSRVTVLPLQQHPINTVPTGVSSVPPPGPARPVTERQMSVPAALQPPFAISLRIWQKLHLRYLKCFFSLQGIFSLPDWYR